MTLATTSAPRRAFVLTTEHLLRSVMGAMLALGCVSFIEPSPYELFFFLLAPVALLRGLSITRPTLLMLILVFVSVGSEILAVMPHLDAPAIQDQMPPRVFVIYSVYLWGSAVLFALVFTRQAEARVSLALKCYGFSCVFAGVWGFLSYLNIAGIGDRELIVGRVAGPFKDPNVLGSYCVLGTVFFIQALFTSNGMRWWVSIVGLAVTSIGGVFLSFSRGSWGATLFAVILMIITMYVSGDPSLRRKIKRSCIVVALAVPMLLGIVFSNETLRSTVTDRMKVSQDYDSGTTGRFGNQMRSIPMLMERPLGFGPHRFAVYFDLDPHNSFIGAFSAGGWVGGCNFILIVLSTSFIGLRLAFTKGPLQRSAQVVGPAMIGLFLQAMQIDVDHWRFVFLMIGLLWGMEAARSLMPHETKSRGRAQLKATA